MHDRRKVESGTGLMDRVGSWSAIVGATAVLALMLLMTADAIGRKLVGRSLPGALEASESLMVIAVFLPLMYVQRKGGHIVVTVATRALPRRWQELMDAIATFVGFLLFAVIVWVVGGKAWGSFLSREIRIGTVVFPVWPFRGVMTAGLLLFAVQLAVSSFGHFRRSRLAEDDFTEPGDSAPPDAGLIG